MPRSVFGDAWDAAQKAWQATKDAASGFGDSRAARPTDANLNQVEHDKLPEETDKPSQGVPVKKPTKNPDLETELQ